MLAIRPAREADADQLIAFVQRLAAEPRNNILHDPGTFNPAVAWARETRVIKRIELEVFVRNEGAIKLYERFEFVVEGRKRQSAYKDGESIDALMMARWLD